MAKQSRSVPVMQAVLDAVAERLLNGDESLIRIPEVCEATGVNYGSVYHHFGSREGVIDAAYHMMFSRLVDEDIEMLGDVSARANSFEEYVMSLQPILTTVSSGEGRVARRALRQRILAASTTRPELRVLIGITQARLTTELMRAVQYGQDRNWLRRDISARATAVILQTLVFGRTLDDVSINPIDDREWESAMSVLFAEFVNVHQ